MAKTDQGLQTTSIKGKDYVMVNERIRYFNEHYPNGCIASAIEYEGGFVRCRTIVTPDVANKDRFFTGYSEEDRLFGMINKTNATENAETSAVGRALGMMGIGITTSVASAEEVAGALEKNTVNKDEVKQKSLDETKKIADTLTPEKKDTLVERMRKSGRFSEADLAYVQGTKTPVKPTSPAFVERAEHVGKESK